MHNVAVEYIHTKGKKVEKIRLEASLPENWEEVTSKQFKALLPLLYGKYPFSDTSNLRVDLVKALVFSHRNPLKRRKYRKAFPHLTDITIVELSDLVKFLWETSPSIALMKSFRHGLNRYYLPKDNLENAIMLEYILCDAYLEGVAEEENLLQSELLNKLIATLCRPKRFGWSLIRRFPGLNTGDCRQKFNQEIMESRAKKLENLPLALKLFVLFFFMGCKKHVMDEYPLLFPEPKKGASSQANEDPYSWAETLKDVAATKLYGNYDETAYYNLHTILTNLQFERKRQLEQEANRPKK